MSLWEFSYDIRYEHSKKYIILHGLTLVLASRNLLKALLSKMKIFSKYCHARIAIHLRMTSRYMTLNHDSKCNIFRINNKTKNCNSYFIACKDSCFQENKIFEARVKKENNVVMQNCSYEFRHFSLSFYIIYIYDRNKENRNVEGNIT